MSQGLPVQAAGQPKTERHVIRLTSTFHLREIPQRLLIKRQGKIVFSIGRVIGNVFNLFSTVQSCIFRYNYSFPVGNPMLMGVN
ncbi:hypothetical protein HDF16_003576 [Granulicella aggregans]|uniref:Uncharacterized protein n=1 Tax=Granulicella aggregans TaxID=474949 RepID=A0A7W7ZFC6_9BACT|nr:hypothetical protein [Granulicella aggregans]